MVLLRDGAQNARGYDSSICNFSFGGYPIQFHIVQIGTDGNDEPVITSGGGGPTSEVNAKENQTNVTMVTGSDSDIPRDALTFSITGGADGDLFNVDSISGVLTFKTAPSRATPTDSDTDGIYEVTVQVADGNGGIDGQDISVRVTSETVGELDYEDYANGSGSPFPAGSTPEQKDINSDFDGYVRTNGEEFAAGTDPANANKDPRRKQRGI